ncbi:hypothetical protein P3T25_003770 [Paraburkholderia sp. GAS32]
MCHEPLFGAHTRLSRAERFLNCQMKSNSLHKKTGSVSARRSLRFQLPQGTCLLHCQLPIYHRKKDISELIVNMLIIVSTYSLFDT